MFSLFAPRARRRVGALTASPFTASPFVALLLAALVLAPTAVAGQQPVPPVALPERVSLAEALTIAERQNPGFRQVLNDEELEDARVRRQRAEYLPSLSASVSSNAGGSRVYTGTDNFGNPVRLDNPLSFQNSGSTQSIGASMNLFDFGRREANLGQARANRRATLATIEQRRLQLRTEVTRNYYQALRTEAAIAIAERQLAAARDQLTLTDRKFRVATATREDVLGARQQVATSEGSLVQARGEARKARLLLAEQIGVEVTDDFALADTIPDFAAVRIGVDSLVGLALRVNPEILAADARVASADRGVRVARTGYLPAINLGASFGRSMNSRGRDAFLRVDPVDQNYGMSLSFNVPLFDRLQTATTSAQARIQRDDQRQAYRAQRLSVERQVRSLAIDLENAQERLLRTREAVAFGRERLELAEQSFQSGILNFDQYQLVLDRLVSAERDELDARVTLATAVVNLEQVVGTTILTP